MRKSPQQFTKNKERVRSLQRETIERYLRPKLGQLRYFGLPSSNLGDVSEWAPLFREFVAVERGERNKEWELQHELVFQAFRRGLFNKVTLLRGDIDMIITKGKDTFGNRVAFPFDVVSLDYSGGLFYRNASGDFARLKAISSVLLRQADKKASFVLLVSCNLDQIDQGEVRNTLTNIQTELVRYGVEAEKVINAYLNHAKDEARLKLYVPYFVNQLSAKHHLNCETQEVIFYEGNKKTRMMAFRFHCSFDLRTESLRLPRERLSQIVNMPFIELVDGEDKHNTLGLPKLRLPDMKEANDAQ